MEEFTAKYGSAISWVLSGFDRLVFRGSMRCLCFAEGLASYLCYRKVLLKDFGDFSHAITERVKQASLAPVEALGRIVRYLPSAAVSKEQIARDIAREQGITEGPVCVLRCVEPCRTFEVYRNRDERKLQIVGRIRKCTFLYHYLVHPEFGFMNARLQTWFPFSIQVCINGREWLARQMADERLGFSRMDNCFVDLQDPTRAQELMDAQRSANWPELLDGIVQTLNPLHRELFGSFCSGYYWSVHQSEWATDIAFADPQRLRRLYPMLVRHGMTALSSPDVMRFLGHKIGPKDRIPTAYAGEVTTDLKTRQEGVRIKHYVNGNSVKAYDKAYTNQTAVLRTETTMNNPRDFKVYRPKEGGDDRTLDWRSLRRGVADLYRRAQVSDAANKRYLNALASADDSIRLQELLAPVTSSVTWGGKSIRPLHPLDEADAKLLECVGRGEFAINGLRNRDLQRLLYPSTEALAPQEARRRSARVTRLLRMLRAHRVIAKVPHTHRYQVTDYGRKLISAVLTARDASVSQLLKQAA